MNLLATLLHHANRGWKDERFYAVKKRILKKYGTHLGYDIQFIEGKKCYSCDGTGIYTGYHWDRGIYSEGCYKCYSGWYKRPVWNVLERLSFGGYTFHQPYERLYYKPETVNTVIEGYITHNNSKWYKECRTVLFVLYDFDRWFKQYKRDLGSGWRMQWWNPKNYLNNLVHLIKKGKNAVPFAKTYRYDHETDELPF